MEKNYFCEEEFHLAPIPLWLSVAIQIALLLLTAYFSMLEVVAESLNESRLERLKDEGSEQAERLLPLLPQMQDAAESMYTMGTLLNLFSGLFACAAFLPRLVALTPGLPLEWVYLVAMGLILCLIVRLIGVVFPRRRASLEVDKLCLSMFDALRKMQRLTRPMTSLIGGIANALLKLVGADPEQAGDPVTEDEILTMVDRSEEKGVIESNEREMIENIFEFNNLNAEDCMTHRTGIYAIALDSTPEEIIAMIQESGNSRFPVYREDIDNVVGILSARRFFLNLLSKEPRPLEELIRPAFFVPESMHTDTLFHEMQRRKDHIAIVVDEYGGTSGLITMEDLLEQIVGNIYDEFDPQEEQPIQPQPDGTWRVAGSCDLETLCETLDIEPIDDEEYDTVGGLVFSQLTAIPDDGSHPEVECFGLHIRVDSLVDRRVEWTTIWKLPPQTDEEEKGE